MFDHFEHIEQNQIFTYLVSPGDDICKSLPHARNWKLTGV